MSSNHLNVNVNKLLIKQNGTSQKMTSIKISVLGKGEVGKSSVTYRFLRKDVPESHDPTIEDKYKAYETIMGENVEVEVVDTAGIEDYQNLLDMWISYADGFVLVFSITDKESFDVLAEKYDRIISSKGISCPVVLIGNKCDLVDARVVESLDARKFGNTWNSKYFESSAQMNMNCTEPFIHLATVICQRKMHLIEKKQDKTPCCIIV